MSTERIISPANWPMTQHPSLSDLWYPADHTPVQSVIFSKVRWTVPEARAWLQRFGARSEKLHVTDNFYRFRQFDPDSKKNRYQTTKIPQYPGIEIIYEYPLPYITSHT
jgi:hypothetical protein